MRASKEGPDGKETHISGAEGIFGKTEIERVVAEYSRRAMEHPRGLPDSIVVTVEEIQGSPTEAALLPVFTGMSGSPGEARLIVAEALSRLGISEQAIDQAFQVLFSETTMRGASLIMKGSGMRAEPDKERGVRVSRLGMVRSERQKLSRLLSRLRINTPTVREALILASKVASCPGVVAEVCVSDDPDYTTGYISSPELGYLRLPHIKALGDLRGG
ncbi:MAG: 6-carboxyhexanoate--CoA ligase, partial [Nitrospirales bacterium]|nr:6-carboxyhexanoate--CoA ligase [Nitrospirales bacterium]